MWLETHSPVRSTASDLVPNIFSPIDPSSGSYNASPWLANGKESLATSSDTASLQKPMMELVHDLVRRLTADAAGALWSAQLSPIFSDARG